jgi:hypothetical protein
MIPYLALLHLPEAVEVVAAIHRKVRPETTAVLAAVGHKVFRAALATRPVRFHHKAAMVVQV